MMTKQPISVTLNVENVAWLKGRASAAGVRSVSELLDQLVTRARKKGHAGSARSVVGTVEIDASDPELETADIAIRNLFRLDGKSVKSGVADLRAAVTDTHPLVFHGAANKRLSARVAALFDRCERRDFIIYVPAAVIWECSLLARTGRIHLRRSTRDFFDDLFSNPAYQPLDISAADVFLADEMSFNRDPFDALIVASARTAGLPLITRDRAIQESGAVKTIW